MKLVFSSRLTPAVARSTIAVSMRKDKAISSGTLSGKAQGDVGASVTTPDPATAAKDAFSQRVGSMLSSLAQRVLEAQAKRFNEMKAAVDKLRALPSPKLAAKAAAKAAAKERALMLKGLLDMLKQMMLGATPAQAKALAAQLKDIAKELAAMGKLLAGGGGESAATSAPAASETANSGAGESAGSAAAAAEASVDPGAGDAAAPVDPAAGNAPAVAAPAVVSAPLSPSESAASSESDTDTASGEKQTVDHAGGTATPSAAASFPNARQALAAYAAEAMRNAQGSAGKSGAEKRTDAELKNALQEALKSLRALIALLKQKLAASHNKDLEEAEKKMTELARSLAEAGSPNGSDAQAPAQTAADSGTTDAVAATVASAVATDVGDGAGGIGVDLSVGDAAVVVTENVDVSA